MSRSRTSREVLLPAPRSPPGFSQATSSPTPSSCPSAARWMCGAAQSLGMMIVVACCRARGAARSSPSPRPSSSGAFRLNGAASPWPRTGWGGRPSGGRRWAGGSRTTSRGAGSSTSTCRWGARRGHAGVLTTLLTLARTHGYTLTVIAFALNLVIVWVALRWASLIGRALGRRMPGDHQGVQSSPRGHRRHLRPARHHEGRDVALTPATRTDSPDRLGRSSPDPRPSGSRDSAEYRRVGCSIDWRRSCCQPVT